MHNQCETRQNSPIHLNILLIASITVETNLYAARPAGGRAAGHPLSPVHTQAELLVAESWRTCELRTSATRIRNLGGRDLLENLTRTRRRIDAQLMKDGVNSRPWRPGCAAAGATRTGECRRTAGTAAGGGPWMKPSEGKGPMQQEICRSCPGCVTCSPCAGIRSATGALQGRRRRVKTAST